MLATTAARVLGWYFRSRARLDSPAMLQLDENAEAFITLSGLAREELLAEVSTVGLALARIPERDRLILMERYDPERGLTDLELAKVLHCDREGTRAAHTAALVAMGGQLVKMRLVKMNGKPTWAQ